MNEESTVLRSDQEYNVNVVKTSVKCSEPHYRGDEPVFRQTLISCPLLCLCYPNKNVIKNNITSSVIHIIVCLPKIE